MSKIMPAEDKDKSTLKVEPSSPPVPGKVVGSVVEPSKPPSPETAEPANKESTQQVPKNKETVDTEGPKKSAKRIPEKVLYSWSAPARPFKKRGKEFWVTAGAIIIVIGLVFFAIEGIMPVLLLIALTFLFYVMNSVKPEIIEYKITNYGVRMASKTTEWDRVSRFWFSKRFESDLLIFETAGFTGRLELVINQTDIDQLRNVLGKYITEEEVPPTYIDKTANWLSRKMPGNN
jgi:hypothetical protein